MREDGWHVQAKVRKVLTLHTERKHHLEMSAGVNAIGRDVRRSLGRRPINIPDFLVGVSITGALSRRRSASQLLAARS